MIYQLLFHENQNIQLKYNLPHQKDYQNKKLEDFLAKEKLKKEQKKLAENKTKPKGGQDGKKNTK